MNDLWSFEIASGNWTWLSGTNSFANKGIFPGTVGGVGIPAARFSSAAWIGFNGDLFIFAGETRKFHF